MKKVFIIAGALAGILLLAAILIPLLFKDKIIDLVKTAANQQLNAKLEFADFDLSLFADFPNLSFSLDKLTILNNAPFEGDTLVAFDKLQTSLELFSLMRGETKVRSIQLDGPRLKLVALEDGSVNWNIMKDTTAAKTETTESSYQFDLQKYTINNGQLVYYDQATNMMAVVKGLNHSGSGDFTQDRFSLRTLTAIDSLTFGSGEVNYLNKVNTRLKADVEVDNVAQKYTLRENELRLNDLVLRFAGSVAQTGDKMNLDLKFEAPQNDFKNLVSLIPAIYAKDFKQLKSSGQFALQGEAKGAYAEKQYPAFNVKVQVNDGMFQYPQLPTAVNHVNMNLVVNNAGGDLDNTVIDLTKFHVELGREPFDARVTVKTPISDPHLAANIKGKINLGEIKNFMPLQAGTELAGVIDADLNLAGNMSSLQRKQYEKFNAAGNIAFRDLIYNAKALPEKVTVSRAQLTFTPANVKLSDLNCQLGNSDVQADGTLDNFLPYLLNDQTLQGTLSLQSRFFDLDPWMAGESSKLSAVALPDNIEFILNSVFQEVKYAKMEIQNVRGTMRLKDRTLHMDDVGMNMLNGSVVMNGRYSTPPDKPVNIVFALKVTEVNIGQTFENFVTVQKFAPIAQNLEGNFSSNLQFTIDVDASLMPIFGTLDSKGGLRIANAALAGFTPLIKLAEALKLEQYKQLVLKDLKPSFYIRTGRFFLEPFSFTAANTEFVVSGSYGIDQTMDYSLKMRVPSKELNQQANALVNNLLNKKIDPLQNEYVDLTGFIKGTLKDPQVKISGADIVKGATAQATDLLKQQLEKRKKAAMDSLADGALAKPKAAADSLRRAAADTVKSETERLKAEAKKKLKKLFKP